MTELVEVKVFTNVYGKIYYRDFPANGVKEIIVVIPFNDKGKTWALPIIGKTSMSGEYFLDDRAEEPILLSNNSISKQLLDTLINLVANTSKKQIEEEEDDPSDTWKEVTIATLNSHYSELKGFLIEFEKRLNVEQYPECRAIKEALEHFRKNDDATTQQMKEYDDQLKQEFKEKGLTK